MVSFDFNGFVQSISTTAARFPGREAATSSPWARVGDWPMASVPETRCVKKMKASRKTESGQTRSRPALLIVAGCDAPPVRVPVELVRF